MKNAVKVCTQLKKKKHVIVYCMLLDSELLGNPYKLEKYKESNFLYSISGETAGLAPTKSGDDLIRRTLISGWKGNLYSKSDQYVFSFLRKSLPKAKSEGFNGENNGRFILLKNVTSKREYVKLLKTTEISRFYYCSACLNLLVLYFANKTELDKRWSTKITEVSVIRRSSSFYRCISLFLFSLFLLFTPLSFSNLP